mmetsp:Transcript_56164/g.125404  ORF Transcript_56164/g.125404 Transcript_56164/m.125404 type:complete len:83 (-) Transcript_56164:351-599(-)
MPVFTTLTEELIAPRAFPCAATTTRVPAVSTAALTMQRLAVIETLLAVRLAEIRALVAWHELLARPSLCAVITPVAPTHLTV